MQKAVVIKTFTDRYPLIGPALWILCIQYFIVQIIAGLRFNPSYSLRSNTISDLGNSSCGLYTGRYVCSPEHFIMNASFLILGLTMALGSLLIYQEFREDTATLIGFSCMTIAGLGTCIVGLFPENTIGILHLLGAAQPFLIGNIALIIFSRALPIPKLFRYYSFLSGVIALIALVLFISHHYLGLGIGGIERIVAYPQTLWLIIFGIYISSSHVKRLRS